MYIKAKYPKTERWYMNIETQGYGSGKNQNSSSVSNEDTSHLESTVSSGQFNGLDQSSGTTTNENQERVVNPPAPVAELELWAIVNEGGNRDSGNDLTYIDENGDTQNQFVGNNGSSFAWLSTTEYAIATATGDPYTIKRLAKGEANILATGYDLVTGFSTQNQLDNAFAAGESVATVQAEYDAA